MTMTMIMNIGFGLEMRGIGRAARDDAVHRTAKLLQVTALLDRRPKDLSGGQRQRVAMGRAIVRNPALFLFDEPLSNFDAKLRAQIKRLHERLGTTIVYVTHDQVEAMTLGTRVAVMRAGIIQLDRVLTPPLVLRTLREHQDIIAACKAREPALAELALRAHFSAALQRYLGLFLTERVAATELAPKVASYTDGTSKTRRTVRQ